MKKAISLALVVIIAISCIPFSVFADTISGFDYTNYYQVDYIQGDGNAYINSGVATNKNTRIESVWAGGSDSSYFYGVNSSGSSAGYFDFTINASGKYQMRTVSNNAVVLGNVLSGQFTARQYANYGESIIQNGSTVYSNSHVSSTSGHSLSLYLFARNNQGSVSTNKSTAKLYSMTITINDVVVRNFVPAVSKSTQAVGLFDTVNQQFYSNAGSGSFTYGGTIPTRYTIITGVDPEGSGTVTGGGEYDSGSVVVLQASANTGYQFVRWSDNDTSNPRSITVSSSASYTAIFEESSTPVQQYTVSTSVSPSGSGTVSGGGTYDAGSTITLTATANNGYSFSSWSDGVSSSSRSVVVNSNLSFTAQFVEDPDPTETYTVTLTAGSGGTVSGGGEYSEGSNITITATPNSGYVFSSWSDGSTVNPRNLTVTGNVNLTAYFNRDPARNIVVGSYVDVIGVDHESNISYVYTIQDHGSNTSVGYRYYAAPVDNSGTLEDSVTYVFYNLHVIFNDDYVGSAVVQIYKQETPGGTTYSKILERTLYVNGNYMTLGFSRSDLAVNILDSSFNVYVNVQGLTKKISAESLIQDGTNESNESVDALDDQNDNLNNAITDFNDIESEFNDDLNESLENIPVTSPSAWGSNFLTSAAWVSEQFNRLTVGNPFGSILGFSLLLGLSLLIIGKVLG